MNNFFVNQRRGLKNQIRELIDNTPNIEDEELLKIFGRRTGMKHTTIMKMIGEVRLEAGRKDDE